MLKKKIRVLIVEDSPVVRILLKFLLESDPEIEVIGMVEDGESAVEFVAKNKPDLVTMDLILPKMNGFEATRIIMEKTPTPIIIVSAAGDPNNVNICFTTLEVGALAFLKKPTAITDPDYHKRAQEIIQTVKLISKVKWINENNHLRPVSYISPEGKAELKPVKVAPNPIPDVIKIVGIGSSTGGPQALEKILSHLTKSFPVPIVIVQHIATGFISGLVNWLNQTSKVVVTFAKHKEPAKPGIAYVAPDGFHLQIKAGNQLFLTNDPPINGLRPSVSKLFQSINDVYGKNSIGVLLTGMGRDGAQELLAMKTKGAYTIVQDQTSSLVFGMPKAAIEMGAASTILPLEEIGPEICRATKSYQKMER